MFFDIRTAALDDLVDQRVRLAVSLLGAYRIRARLGVWDGTRCDLLIASADDSYARQTIALAQLRGTSVIALGETSDDPHILRISEYTPAAVLVKHIRDGLQRHRPLPPAGPRGESPQPGLCRLATSPLRGKAVDATCNGRSVLLRPQVGRVYATTHSDLLAVTDALSGSDWDMSVVERPESTQDLVSTSLESFLMRAAYRAADRLPEFPEGRYRLDVWPDLGTLPSLVGTLQVSKLLVDNARSVRELNDALGGIDRHELNACLWAFAAADLLREVEPVNGEVIANARAPRMRGSIWSSLARRFGLLHT